MEKTTVDLDQKELKLLVAVILSQKYSLGDGVVLIPLCQKLESLIIPEPKAEDKVIN